MADTDTAELPTVEELWAVVKEIQDPELRMSIVDLGLVYHVDIDDEGLVTIDLTLTSPGCPVGPMIQGQAYHMLTQIEGVEDVEVNLVWEPPWDPRTMASEEVKMMLGIW
jgi:metal-sulfur cluster biosynthetic enzyme